MSVDLYWLEARDGKIQCLYAGCNQTELARVMKCQKYWDGIIWLPDISPHKKYAPLDVQKGDIERRVRQWFGMALTSRPATDSEDFS